MSSGLGIDRWIRGIEITSSNQDLVLTEDDGSSTQSVTVTIPTGTYFAVLPANLPSHIDSLYGEVDTQLSNNNPLGTGDYGLFRRDPTDGTFAKHSGMGLDYTDTDLADFALDFSASTLPPEIFGWAPTVSSILWASADGGTDDLVLEGPDTAGYCWASPRIAKKPSDPVYEQGHRRVSYDNRVNARWDKWRLRDFQYFNLPAVHVRNGRATRGKYAEVGGLNSGDRNNAFEDIWEWLAAGEEAIVIHDHGDTNDDIRSAQDEFELVRMQEDDLSGEVTFADIYNERDRQAEFYDLEITVERSPDWTGYTY